MFKIPKSSLINGQWQGGGESFTLLNKFTLEPIAEISSASPEQVEQAVASAVEAFQSGLPSARQRALILQCAGDLLDKRIDEFVEIMCLEAGFPKRDAANEVARAIETLVLCAEEAKRLSGEAIAFSGAPGITGRIGFTLRAPLGVVAAITPFNAPLNTVCHKVGPAFAAGNAVVLKPSDKTPLTANLLALCFQESGAPAGSFSVLQGGVPVAKELLDDDRVAFYAFTGSTAAGKSIQAAAGVRRTQMELGSISATVVLDDADLDNAVAKCLGSSFRKAGQVCTSIQLLMIQKGIKAKFSKKFIAAAEQLKVGDPAAENIDVGPMISVEAAQRVEKMLVGQPVVFGGLRDGAVLSPTVVDEPDENSILFSEEIFGPVVCLVAIDLLEDAIERINAGAYGLAAGIFTTNIQSALNAAMRLDVGGVHINETCSSRVDLMPYGGVKASGFGLEGPHYAVREMSYERLVTFSEVNNCGVLNGALKGDESVEGKQ